ncbi:MAG TPA: hypothetical protein VLV29_02510 [Steroidobacteraceae bacterium]|nr:hypothetical protein [Steroidobacteraceae bacterium]
MKRAEVFGLLLALAAGLAGCDNPNADVTAGREGGNAVNGSVNVPAGQHSGAVGTVNGAVHVGENAQVGAVSDVNGPIELGAHVSAASVSLVNGPVSLGEAAHVSGGVETVNGEIRLASGAEVGGSVKNVNGHIVLNAAHVGGGLRTVGGDIDVLGSSRVEGGIVVEKGGWFNTDLKKPRIVIGPGATVQGALHFERPVQLYVSDKATIGAVSGATPVVFSGEQPPA